MQRNFAAITTALALSPAAFAQQVAPQTHANAEHSPWLYGSLGYTFEGAKGFEFAAGVQADWHDRIYVRFSPLNLVLTDAKGYHEDTFSNGQTRCRDESNGQFATDESCTGLDYRVDADAYLRLNHHILIGGGVIHTVSSDFTPEREGNTDGFVAVMFETSKNFGVEIRGGKDNAAIRLRASI